jgi:hypothetical protein
MKKGAGYGENAGSAVTVVRSLRLNSANLHDMIFRPPGIGVDKEEHWPDQK